MNGPGLRGVTNAVADSVAYQVAESNRPRWPYIPPPRVVYQLHSFSTAIMLESKPACILVVNFLS